MNPTRPLDRRLSVAPMMDVTDRHCRYLLRLITRRTLLYTEMVTAAAVIHGNRARLLGFDPFEKPLALQLAGAEPEALARAAAHGQDFGYDEINLNIGCPSERVQNARFGACLMAEPETVASCVAEIRKAIDLPVTVKCRIGIDGRERYEDLRAFVDRVAEAGCRSFIVHARIAVLAGLSPKQNREVPPLRYDDVRRLKAERPELEIVLNGGIGALDQARAHLDTFDGVMIGRAAYERPMMLAEADRQIFGVGGAPPDRHAIARAMIPYVEAELARGGQFYGIARHMLGLFNGLPGARAFRRYLAENGPRATAGAAVLARAIDLVPEPSSAQAAE
ncbi:MAG: tRNA dihydrouridine(20/20a) synthase DusA [Alphaproteobacteria bacterium]|nr:tRNA dihydrouridine(20/20a) synthase DusA [Alphaproteobacteria bacterium]